MAGEIYIKDILELSYRMAIEAKRMQTLKMPLPKGLELGDSLESKMEKANGYSSRFEMLAHLDDMGITYFPHFADSEYHFKILVPDNKVDAVKELIEKSGYVSVNPVKKQDYNT